MPAFGTAVALEQFTTFGDLLKYLRRRAGLTQRELSIAVGYSDTQISRLELNQRPPDLATIAALFFPALGLEHEPATAERLLALAAGMQRTDSPAAGLPPFKGLRYFDEGDADLFFGREALVGALAERLVSGLPAERFLGIVGASGSGKSSIVRAGLVPALRWGHAAVQWQIYTLTPTAHPLEALAASLTQATGEAEGKRRDPYRAASFANEFAHDPLALHRFIHGHAESVRRAAAAPPLTPQYGLLVVDQFEELFTLCRDEAEQRAFVDNLMQAVVEPDGHTCVVITLRADFYARCAPYAALREALSARQVYIGPLGVEELRRVIEEPAHRGGWELEPGLVDILLQDLGADRARLPEPGALPLLSHALLETWQRRRGHTLTISGYLASGGVRGAIAETAEAVFQDELDARQRILARGIFLRLTELGDSDAVAETRRRVTYDELVPQPEDAAAVREVLTKLADARLITTDEDVAEVAHEALIREWPTLRGWLEENRDGLRLHRHLTLTADGWARQGRDPGELYRGARLAQAREWAAAHLDSLNSLEREFLDASRSRADQEEAEREAQRQRELESVRQLAEAEQRRAEQQSRAAGQLRRRAVYLGVALVLTVAAAATAALFANRNAANFTRSEAQRLAAEANSLQQAVADPQLIALLSLRSVNTQHTLEGDTALTGAAALPLPLRVFTDEESGNGIYSVAFSPDGRYALTGSYEGVVRLWDIHTGELARSFTRDDRGVRAIFTADGETIFTGDHDGMVRSYEAASGQLLTSFRASPDWLTDIRLSSDGRYLLTGGGAPEARLWDIQTGEMLAEYTGHTEQLRELAFSPDGRYVVTTSIDRAARIYARDSGELLHTLTGHTNELTSVAVSPDSRTIVTGSWDKTARLWDVETGAELHQFTGHGYWVHAVAFSPDGRLLLTGSADKTARLWDVETGAELHQFSGQTEAILTVAFSADGRYILTGGHDRTAWLWDLAQADGEHPMFAGHTNSVYGVAFSPDGQRVASVGADNVVRLWDPRTGQEVRTFTGHDDWVNSVVFSPDGRYLLTGGLDQTARLWDTQTGQQLRRFAHDPGGVSIVDFSADGRYVLTGGWDGTAKRWDAQTGDLLTTYGVSSPDCCGGPYSVYGVAFSPNGRYVLTGSYDNSVRLWDAETGEQVREFTGHTDGVNGVSFSPDGRFALSASYDKTARLWEVETGKELLSLSGHTAYLYSAVFSPDGRLALTGSADNTARLWDLQTGTEVRRFTGHTASVEWAVFAPDGRTFATASDDGTVRVWDADYTDTVDYLCAHLLRDFTAEERSRFHLNDTAPTCP